MVFIFQKIQGLLCQKSATIYNRVTGLMESYIEQLHNRLRWLIFECPYTEYNQQEVDFIIDKLLQYQKVNEDLIESSCISISLGPSSNKITQL